jgi:hypothetical protein
MSITPVYLESKKLDYHYYAGLPTLETQYQLAQDEERPLPPPVSERGLFRTYRCSNVS